MTAARSLGERGGSPYRRRRRRLGGPLVRFARFGRAASATAVRSADARYVEEPEGSGYPGEIVSIDPLRARTVNADKAAAGLSEGLVTMWMSEGAAAGELADVSVLAHQLLNLLCPTMTVLDGLEQGSLVGHDDFDRPLVVIARQNAERISVVLRALARGNIAAAEMIAFEESETRACASRRSPSNTCAKT